MFPQLGSLLPRIVSPGIPLLLARQRGTIRKMIALKKRLLSRQQREDAGPRLAERGIESSIVSRALSTDGFSYQSGFAAPAEGRHLMTCLAQTLGQLRDDVITTKPERDAPAWRPFDQAGSIEWHNDFSS